MTWLGGGGVIRTIGIDAATTAWVNAVVANGGSVSAGRKATVDDLIVGLKNVSLFTKLDRLWLFAGEDQPSALTDIIATALATAVNSPPFTADRGYTGTDASSTIYIDTGFNPATAGGNFTQDAAHISAWSNTNAASSAGGGVIFGQRSAGHFSEITAKYSDGNFYADINDNGASAGTANATSTGHYIANRSAAAAVQGYKNGASAYTHTLASLSLVSNNFFALATDSAGSAAFGSALQTCMASIGGNLSGTDAINLYNLLRTYMTAVGVP